MQQRLNKEYDNLPAAVLSLAETHLQGNLPQVRDKIKRTSESLGESMVREGSSLRENFVLFGGAQVVVRCLQVPVDAGEARHSGWRGEHTQEKSVWELRKDCLVLLRDLAYATPVL